MNPKYICVNKAADIIKKGGVVAIPTETVYGLAGSVFNESALNKIFQIKKRPFFNPLIIHCENKKHLNQFHTTNNLILHNLIDDFSPGPLTFILNKSSLVNPLITAGQNKVGLRIPQHPLTLQLIKKTGALCAPSANLFSQLSPTKAEHVYHIFKEEVFILDGGECKGGIESTVLEPDFTQNIFHILRLGLISKKDLQLWLKKQKYKKWKINTTSSSVSPGQFKNHYQPAVPLIIISTQNKNLLKKSEILKHLKKLFPLKIFKQLTLCASAILSARKLYDDLNILSQNPNHIIYVIKQNPILESWEAIWDRLEKASYQKILLKN